MTRTKLFISHASDDKLQFVRPLADALRKTFDVWYDEYELVIGRSLREQIDAGLRACDFGVVVLSTAFFAKKWPVAELNGLFALEDANRKIILPVWHGVTADSVRKFSPILADRFAVLSEVGIDGVVDKISIAIEVSMRSQQVLAPDEAEIELRRAMQAITTFELDEAILRSDDGVRLFQQSFKELGRYISSRLANSAFPKRFSVEIQNDQISIVAPYAVRAYIQSHSVYSNTVHGAWIEFFILIRTGLTDSTENDPVETLRWNITCTSETSLGFVESSGRPPIGVSEVASIVVQHLSRQILTRVRNIRSR